MISASKPADQDQPPDEKHSMIIDMRFCKNRTTAFQVLDVCNNLHQLPHCWHVYIILSIEFACLSLQWLTGIINLCSTHHYFSLKTPKKQFILLDFLSKPQHRISCCTCIIGLLQKLDPASSVRIWSLTGIDFQCIVIQQLLHFRYIDTMFLVSYHPKK